MKIGCLGYGEVGSAFANRLAERGISVVCHDPRVSEAGGAHLNITFVKFSEAVAGNDFVLSMVTTTIAERIAADAARHLEGGQFYVDLNSTAPAKKRAIAKIVENSGAHFVEGAIMEAMAAAGANARILIGGAHMSHAAEILAEVGLNCEAYREDVGAASLFKMLRSVFSKGVEAVLIETLLAAERGGVREDIWAEIQRTFQNTPFEKMAHGWVTSHASACKRRRDELAQVNDVVRDLGLTPQMCAAASQVFEASVADGLNDAFDHPPAEMTDVVEWLNRHRSTTA